MKNRPKSRPTMFLLDLLYKTVLWCFLFDFMLISNGTGHSFIVFLHKKGDIIFWIYLLFLRHVKTLFWNKILALLKSILGNFFMTKILPWKIAQMAKFCQSGHPGPKWQKQSCDLGHTLLCHLSGTWMFTKPTTGDLFYWFCRNFPLAKNTSLSGQGVCRSEDEPIGWIRTHRIGPALRVEGRSERGRTEPQIIRILPEVPHPRLPGRSARNHAVDAG